MFLVFVLRCWRVEEGYSSHFVILHPACCALTNGRSTQQSVFFSFDTDTRTDSMSSRVLPFATTWGVKEIAVPALWPALFARLSREGFRGIECCSPGPFFPFKGHEATFTRLLTDHKMGLVMQVHTCDYPVGNDSVTDHIKSLRRKAHEAMQFNPILINCHGGKDSFSRADALHFFDEAVKIEKEVGVPIVHETHRQRILYSPFVLRDLAPQLAPAVKFNADLSHWVVTLERTMCDTKDASFWPAMLKLLCERTHLIHARVGFSQGPQVNDPFAPEHAADTASHLAWWKLIAAGMRKRGVPVIVCPEFGPYPYQPHLPYTMQPVSDLSATVARFGQLLEKELRE